MEPPTKQMTRNLSKSKLISYRQCPKRLWLELHRSDLAKVSQTSAEVFRIGHQVGELAHALYDPDQSGTLIDLKSEGVGQSLARTAEMLSSRNPIFEAGFAAGGALAFNDALLPLGERGWRMVEVKASGSVKDYQRDDLAIQAYIVRRAGVQLDAAAIAHIDTSWTYPGGGDYRGLLKEVDLTREAFGRTKEVEDWIAGAHAIADLTEVPPRATGPHCSIPFDCGFISHCGGAEEAAAHPVEWLPRIASVRLKTFIEANGVRDMKQVPADLLSATQRRVRDCTVAGQAFFDKAGASSDLAPYSLPALFLDFESIAFAVPIWPGTRPFQQIVFQFSAHRLEHDGSVEHLEFLDLTGEDPSRRLAESLVTACGTHEPIFVYNAGFEGGRLSELSMRFPDLRQSLSSIRSRLVDLWPVAVRRYYHPSQQGSWSIKKLLPALVPALRYENLTGVADGAGAQAAFMEAIDPATSAERRDALRAQLFAYCGLDTWAMVHVWNIFAGSKFELDAAR